MMILMPNRSGNSGSPSASRTIALAEAEGVSPSVYPYAVSTAPHQDRAGGGTAHYGKEAREKQRVAQLNRLEDFLSQQRKMMTS